MQFVIIAHDGENVLEKRMAVRPKHLENMMNAKGKVICAGGILDEEGKPRGSVVVADFASRELLDEYLKTEPYILENVWETVEIRNMNVAVINGMKA